MEKLQYQCSWVAERTWFGFTSSSSSRSKRVKASSLSLVSVASFLLVEVAEDPSERVELPVDQWEARAASRFEVPHLPVQLLEVRIARAAALPPAVYTRSASKSDRSDPST